MLPLIEIPESDTVPVWMFVVNGVELLINIFTICVGIIVTRVVMRHKLFHSNLRLLMHIMGIGWFLLVGSRAASLVQQFIQPQAALGTYILITKYPYSILEISRVFGCSLVVMGAIIGIFERIAASILLDRYEGQKHTKTILLGCVAGMPSILVMTYFSFSAEYGYIMAIVAGIIGIATFVAYTVVDKWNKTRLDLAIKYGLNYTLNQRFQLSENIRAAALVYKSAIFGCFGSIVIVTLILLYRLMETATQVYILRAIYNMYVAFYCIFLILILVTSPHSWRNEFFRQIRVLCPRFIKPNRVNSAAQGANSDVLRARIQNLDGVQLEFSNEESRQRYFNQLSSSWNK